MIPLYQYLVLGALIFGFGLWGALSRTNIIRILMSIELMLNAVNLNILAFNHYTVEGTASGQVFAIFILTVAAAEVAVGLAMVLLIVRNQDVIDINKINLLKG